MSCSLAEELFEDFLDSRLVSAERSLLAAHVERCGPCAAVLEELRWVNALLLQPRRVELAPNFTFATMAEAGALPAPLVQRAPLHAYVVAYLAAAWMLAGAAFWLAPQVTNAWAVSLTEVARSVADALGGLGNVVSHALARRGSTIATILGALLALDATLVVAFGVALAVVRPQYAQRLRS